MKSKSEVFNMDCIEGMKQYPDNYFDLAIVDPPYGIGAGKRVGTIYKAGKEKGGKGFSNTKKYESKKWDSEVPLQNYYDELFRVSKNQIIWGGNYFPLPNSQYFAIWDKGETMYGRDFAECEYAWVSKGGTRIYKTSPNQLNRIHPTQKPVRLYKWLLDKYAKQGDKILDTHLGSGSIAIACHDYGFELTACELDKEYYDKAIQRIINHTNQTKLF
jgi:site-specific DNA-methyltransferase (adenine-specific)